jgi:hypothetical protein
MKNRGITNSLGIPCDSVFILVPVLAMALSALMFSCTATTCLWNNSWFTVRVSFNRGGSFVPSSLPRAISLQANMSLTFFSASTIRSSSCWVLASSVFYLSSEVLHVWTCRPFSASGFLPASFTFHGLTVYPGKVFNSIPVEVNNRSLPPVRFLVLFFVILKDYIILIIASFQELLRCHIFVPPICPCPGLFCWPPSFSLFASSSFCSFSLSLSPSLLLLDNIFLTGKCPVNPR